MGYVKRYSGKLLIQRSKRRTSAKFQQEHSETISSLTYADSLLAHEKKDCFKYEDDGSIVCLELRNGDQSVSGGVIFGTLPDKVDEIVAAQPKKTEPKKPPKGKTDANVSTFAIHKTKLPASTKRALRDLKDIDNFYLKFYKAAWFGETSEGDGKEKFQPIVTRDKKLEYKLDANFDQINFPAIAARTRATASAMGFGRATSPLITHRAAPSWRWIVGLGNASVYENGMTLHHVYGIPYIPGSGVKGMLRTWIIQECFQRSEKIALENEVFRFIFGHGKLDEKTGQIGNVTFFDAFPSKEVSIEPDIMNNHFQDYYDDKAPPADWLQPVPIFFTTVKGGEVEFNLGLNKDQVIGEKGKDLISERFADITIDSPISKLLQSWLADCLQHSGIGAKTAVGYGRFNPVAS